MITQLDGPYVSFQGKKMLNFSSEDFLGLAQHPEVKKNAVKYVLRYGVGPSPSLQQEIEAKLARYLGKKEAALHLSLDRTNGTDITDSFGLTEPKSSAQTVCGSLEKGGGCPVSFIASMQPIQNRAYQISAALLGALDAILNLLPDMDEERSQLAQKQKWLVKVLSDLGLSHPFSEKTRQSFAESEIYVGSPIVIHLTALHTPDDLDQLATALKKLSATDLALAIQSFTPTP